MIVGLLCQEERYDSLRSISERCAAILGGEYALETVCVDWDDQRAGSTVQSLFGACDVVVSMASRLLPVDRGSDSPAIHFAHAWMDHGAGINLFAKARFLRSGDQLVFASSAALAKYSSTYGAGLPASVIPYLVPGFGGEGATPRIGRQELAAQLGLRPDRRWVVTAGRLCEEKNTSLVIETWARLGRTDSQLVIVGEHDPITTTGFAPLDEGPTRRSLERVRAGLVPGAIHIGHVDATGVTDLLAHAHLAINASTAHEEDFGLFAAEAAAAGVPVVGTDWGGLRDIVRDGHTGLLVPTWLEGHRGRFEPSALAELVSRILDNDALRDELGGAAQDRARTEFSEEVFASRLFRLCETVVARRKAVGATIRLTPEPWLEKVYKAALQNACVDRIYTYPGLYECMYESYASKGTADDSRHTTGVKEEYQFKPGLDPRLRP